MGTFNLQAVLLALPVLLRFLFPLILVPARLLMKPATSIVNPGLLPAF